MQLPSCKPALDQHHGQQPKPKFINANLTACPGLSSQMLSQTQITVGAHFPTYET